MNHTSFLVSMPGGSMWILILLPGMALYFLPTLIAASRKHSNVAGLFVLNFLLGWTFIGWVGAFIWSFSTAGKSSPTVIVNNTPQSYTPAQQPSPSLTENSNTQNKIAQLKELKQLLDDGTLTPEEFNQQKAAILS